MKRSYPSVPPRQKRATGLMLAASAAGAWLVANPAHLAFATDVDTISQRVTAQLLSDLPSTSSVNGYMSSLQSNGSWTDIDYANTAQTNWVPLTHLSRLESMAKLYSASNSLLYHNATLAADISSAFNYWISANPTSTNWFDNDIAAPQALGNTMVLVSPMLSSGQIASGQTILGRARADIPHQTGQNVVDEAIAGIDSAIASGSAADMATAFGEIGGTITVVPGNGIQTDYTYQFHGPQLYMGGYGTSYANDTFNWASIAAGTSYAISATQEKLLVDYLLNGTQWFIRGRTLDLAADGRQVTFTSYVGAGTDYVAAIQDALALGNYRTAELQAFLARQQTTIAAGSASSTQNTLSGNRCFFDSDAMVQQRPAFYASVKVVSTRTSQPETGNSQGLENLYVGDGVNQIMVTGNEYLGIQPSWNWRRLPGTTVEQDTRSLTPSGTFGAVKGTTTYAGGVSDGIYGAEAFDYKRFDVTAKKSWFFFDNEEVALGATIHSSNTTYEVDTTINQCLLTTTVSYETTANSTIQTLTTGTVTPANLKWVYQGGVGYFFVSPVSNATIQAIAQSGKWYSLNTAASNSTVTQNIFTLYLNHGAAVSNGTYSYIAVPGITAAGMDAYWAATPIQVLRNDATVQAIRQSSLDVTQAAFYAAGSFAMVPGQTVSASGPSLVMLQRHSNTLSVSASSPQALQMALNVGLSGLSLSDAGSGWFDAFGTGTITFNLPGAPMAGASVGITLVTDGASTPTVALNSNDGLTNSTYTAIAPIALPASMTLQTDAHSTLALVGTIGGPASITKSGPGTLALSGSNTFTGGATITGGTLYANNIAGSATGSGNVTLDGGTLAGTGVILGNVIAGSSPHTLASGAAGSVGTLTLGSLTTNANTTLALDLRSPSGTNDLLAISGNLALNGGTVAISSLTSTGSSSLGYYKIVSYGGTFTGSAAALSLPAVANNIAYTLDTTHDPGFIDIHRGYIGDANDDGTVNLNDLNIVLNNLGASATSWNSGNFDGAPTIDLNDLNAVLNALGTTVPGNASSSALAASSAPEPATLALVTMGAALSLRRRGR